MELERHSVWELYDDRASSLEKFIENFVPAMKLRKEVSEDVIKTYKIIKSLIIHSYYEYEFIDVAFTKVLQTFEMALKIRYRELNDKEWPKNKKLYDLIEWFRTREYFEVNHKEYMDHIRNARNVFSHPQNHSFGGIALFKWFDTITDLINDIHEDIENRKKRFSEIKLLNESFKDLIKNGAKINLMRESHLIYDVGVLFVEEIDGVKSYLFYYKRLYELDENANFLPNQKPPYQLIELKNFDFTFSENLCRFGLFSISIISEREERERFTKWIEEFQKNTHYTVFDAIIDIKIQDHVAIKKRESIHSRHFKD